MVVRLPNNDPNRLARVHDTKWLHMGVRFKFKRFCLLDTVAKLVDAV